MSAKMENEGCEFWLKRPIIKEALEYAAYDVKYLLELHLHLTKEMTKISIDRILFASDKYVKESRDCSDAELFSNSCKAFVSEELFPPVSNFSENSSFFSILKFFLKKKN